MEDSILNDVESIKNICKRYIRAKSSAIEELSLQICVIGHECRRACLLDFIAPQSTQIAQVLVDVKKSLPRYHSLFCLTIGDDDFIYIVHGGLFNVSQRDLNCVRLMNVSGSLSTPRKLTPMEMNSIESCLKWLAEQFLHQCEEQCASNTLKRIERPKIPTWAVFLNGWILGYPGIYILSEGESSNNLSMMPLKVWKFYALIKGKRMELWSFSWPQEHVQDLERWENELTLPQFVKMESLSVILQQVIM